jgi:ABC transporter DrrB family efflux protein
MSAVAAPPRLTIADGVSDSLVVAKRFLLQLLRTPQLIVFTVVQTVLFLLLFKYVFGGSIDIPGIAYSDYLIPAFLTQNAIFDGFAVAIGMATDAKAGLIQRYRSLPMARAAFVSGRALSDLIRQAALLGVIIAVGYGIGFSFHNSIGNILAALVLALALGFAMFWVFAWIGLAVKDSETAQAAITPFFLFTFISTAFVQVETLPGWLQDFAREQPVSQWVNALRGLTQGDRAAALVEHSTGHYVVTSLLWCVAITAVCAPLAVRAYRKL